MDRRRFLVLGAGGLLLGAAACSGSKGAAPNDTTVVTRADALEGDLAIAALMASLENLLVAVYQEGIDRKDKLGPYSAAQQAAIDSAQRQHRDHAIAWNSILSGAGKKGVTGVNLNVKSATTDPQLFRAKDPGAFLSTCQDVESITATTYLAAIGSFQNNAALKVAASIHPVENEHVAVLAYLLGRTLPGDSFGHPDGARPTTDSIG